MTQKEPTTSYSKSILGLQNLPFWSLGTHFGLPKGTCWSQETTLGVLLVIRCSLWCSQGSLGALPETLRSPLGGPSAPPGPSNTYVFLKENNDFQQITFSEKVQRSVGPHDPKRGPREIQPTPRGTLGRVGNRRNWGLQTTVSRAGSFLQHPAAAAWQHRGPWGRSQ